MKYVVSEDKVAPKLNNYKIKVTGLDVSINNSISSAPIKAKKMIISDKHLSSTYVKKRINKKIDKILEFMLRILNDEEGTDEGDSNLALDEVSRLRGVIMNKYKEYLKSEEYKSLLAKLFIIEEEFKKNYSEKMFIDEYITPTIFEQDSKGRSR